MRQVARNGMIHQDGEIFADIVVRILSDFSLKLKEVLSFRVKTGPFFFGNQLRR